MNFYFPTTNSIIKINEYILLDAEAQDFRCKVSQTDAEHFNYQELESVQHSLTHKLHHLYINLFKNTDLYNTKVLLSDFSRDPSGIPIAGQSYGLCFYTISIVAILEKFHLGITLDFTDVIITGKLSNETHWNQLLPVTDIEDKIIHTIENFTSNPAENRNALFIYINDSIDVEKIQKDLQKISINVTFNKDKFEKNKNDFKFSFGQNQTLRIKSIQTTNEIFEELLGHEWNEILNNLERTRDNENQRAANTENLPNRAYIKGVWAFEKDDYEIFKNLGREVDKARCFNSIDRDNFTFGVLTGESGVGKTSFLKAGLIRFLEKEKNYKCYYTEVNKENPLLTLRRKFNLGEPKENPIEDLSEIYIKTFKKEKKILIIFDQFEQFFLSDNKIEKQKFLEALSVLNANPNEYRGFKILLCMRRNLYGEIYLDYIRKIRDLSYDINLFELKNFSKKVALHILKLLSLNATFNFDESILKEFIENHLAFNDFVSPVDLQVFVYVAELPDSDITPETLNQIGMKGIYYLYIEHHFRDKDKENSEEVKLEFRILTCLIEDNGSKPKSIEEINLEVYNPENLDINTIKIFLENKRLILLNPENNKYQLVHEKLIEPIETMAGKVFGKEDRIREFLEDKVFIWGRFNKEKKYLLDLIDYFKVWKDYRPSLAVAGNRELIKEYIKESKKRFVRNLKLISIIPVSIIVGWLGIELFLKTEIGVNVSIKYMRFTIIKKFINDPFNDLWENKFFANIVYQEIKNGNLSILDQILKIPIKIPKQDASDSTDKILINSNICFALSELAIIKKDENILNKILEFSISDIDASDYGDYLDAKDTCLLYISNTYLELYELNNSKTEYLNKAYLLTPSKEKRLMGLLNIISTIGYTPDKNVELFNNINLELQRYKSSKNNNEQEKFENLIEIIQVLFYAGFPDHIIFEYLKEVEESILNKVSKKQAELIANLNWSMSLNLGDLELRQDLENLKMYAKILFLLKQEKKAVIITEKLFDLSYTFKDPNGLLMVAQLYCMMPSYYNKIADTVIAGVIYSNKIKLYNKSFLWKESTFSEDDLGELYYYLSSYGIGESVLQEIILNKNLSFKQYQTDLDVKWQKYIFGSRGKSRGKYDPYKVDLNTIDHWLFPVNLETRIPLTMLDKESYLNDNLYYAALNIARTEYIYGTESIGNEIVSYFIKNKLPKHFKEKNYDDSKIYEYKSRKFEPLLSILLESISYSKNQSFYYEQVSDFLKREKEQRRQNDLSFQRFEILFQRLNLLSNNFITVPSLINTFNLISEMPDKEKFAEMILYNKLIYEDRKYKKILNIFFKNKKDISTKKYISELLNMNPCNPFYHKLQLKHIISSEAESYESKKVFLKTRKYFKLWYYNNTVDDNLIVPYDYNDFYLNWGFYLNRHIYHVDNISRRKLEIELEHYGLMLFGPLAILRK